MRPIALLLLILLAVALGRLDAHMSEKACQPAQSDLQPPKGEEQK